MSGKKKSEVEEEIMPSEEEVVEAAAESEAMDKEDEISEAKGSDASEAAEASESEVEATDAAPAESEDETEESVDEVVEEVLPLTVYLTFDEDKDNIALEVTETFQMDLRKVCNEQGTRFTQFNIEGDLDPINLRLLMKALK